MPVELPGLDIVCLWKLVQRAGPLGPSILPGPARAGPSHVVLLLTNRFCFTRSDIKSSKKQTALLLGAQARCCHSI